MGDSVDNLADRAVIVRAGELGDLLDLVARATDRLDPNDPLTHALRGSAAAVQASLVVEP